MIKQLSEQNIHDINAILTAATILDETVTKHAPLYTKYEFKDSAADVAAGAIQSIIIGGFKYTRD